MTKAIVAIGRVVTFGSAILALVACDVETSGLLETFDPPAPAAGALPSVDETSAGSGSNAPDGGSSAASGAVKPPASPRSLDAGTGAPSPDAGDSGAPTTPALCPNGTTRCATTGACVRDCRAECVGRPVACFACAAGAVVAAAECEPADKPTACIAAPLDRCACATGSASLCPGATDVCASGVCIPCGQEGSAYLRCKAGDDTRCEPSSSGPSDEANLRDLVCH